MKLLILCVLAVIGAAFTASVQSPATRANLNAGYVGVGDRLLHRSYLYKTAIPNAIQSQDLIYRGNATTRITAVQVTEVGYTQFGYPFIVAGGIGQNNVTIRIQSARGYGYYYQADIWGR